MHGVSSPASAKVYAILPGGARGVFENSKLRNHRLHAPSGSHSQDPNKLVIHLLGYL
ncbi:hypothetical protein SLEP1_g2356 [Rubroshorea leprosula]|uniref:Uncharacterized protein n=1 Tax=Rubroshorea leprosula TaxID=152421 RepID=A0AAV5HLA3_9ROSI|nr:hypothetical protein SLEP1_g2356 [Rubroshorea leprosula]